MAPYVRRDDAACGASGALSGCATFMFTLQPRAQSLLLGVLPVRNWLLSAAWLGGSSYAALYSEERATLAHAGHVGGGVTGVLAALAYRRGRMGRGL